MCSNLFFSMNTVDAYFINQSHNPGKLTFVNVSFREKRAAIHKLRRPFKFRLVNISTLHDLARSQAN